MKTGPVVTDKQHRAPSSKQAAGPVLFIDASLTGLKDLRPGIATRDGALLLEYETALALVVKLLATLAVTTVGNNLE